MPTPSVDFQREKRKRPDVIERVLKRKTHETTCIVMKLSSISKYKWFSNGLQRIIYILNQVASEAYQIANYYVLKCLELNQEPILNQSFFYRCCIATGIKVPAFQLKNQDDQLMQQIMEDWRIQRRIQLRNIARQDLHLLGPLLSQLALEMNTCSHTHLQVNFIRRLFRFMKVEWGMNTKKSWKYFYDLFDEKTLDSTLNERDLTFRRWLRYFPSDENIKIHSFHFIKRTWHILKHFNLKLEKAIQTNTKEDSKGIRLFSLLPLKEGFGMSHIMLTNTTLLASLKWMGHHYCKDIETMIIPENVVDIWKELFNIHKYETRSCNFASVISSNGYSASIHLTKLRRIISTTSKSENTYSQRIGCDPGINNLFCGVTQNQEFRQASTREYYHYAKMKQQRHRNNLLVKRHPQYKELLDSLPTLHTSSSDEFRIHAFQVLKVRDILFNFLLDHAILKWKFKTKRFAGKSLARLCRRLVGKHQNNKSQKDSTVVGLGNLSQHPNCIRGHARAPIKAFRKQLSYHATVLDIDEYNTTKKCSRCGEDVVVMPEISLSFPSPSETSIHKKKGHQVVCCRSNKCTTLWSSYGEQFALQGGYIMNRDQNSAVNHLHLLTNELLHLKRPVHLERRIQN